MTLAEYLERGYPLKDFAENLENTLLNLDYAETKITCKDRAELDQVLDVIQDYFMTLHFGFRRADYPAKKKPDWFYLYRYEYDIHIGGGSRDGLDETISLSEIIESTIDSLKDVEVCDDLPELDSLFS